MYEKLPKELRDYPYFGLWKYEQKDGRSTKVPKTVSGYNANSKNLKHFRGLDEVTEKVEWYDGICIALAGGLSVIDIDHCVEDGKLSEMAAEIIEKVNSYTEYSPSGNGIRIIGKTEGFTYDQDKYYVNNRKLGLEVYASRNVGIITITGNAIKEIPLRDFSDVLPEILEKYMKRPDAVTDRYPTDVPGSFLTDEEVIEKRYTAKRNRYLKEHISLEYVLTDN